MTRPIELMREGKKEELWKMCCGFLNLSLEEFMTIQKRLLLEQIKLLRGCEMGRRLMGGAMPDTIEEFREQVPLTTYSDYLPELADKREDVLPAKPAMWIHTVGRIGEYTFKWVPLSERFLCEFERVAGGIGLLASCNRKGDYLVKEHLKTLATMASHDYGSGVVGYLMQRSLGFDLMPPNAEDVTFQDKMKAGFDEALSRGLDALGGLPSILVYAGETLKQCGPGVDARFLLTHPGALARLTKGWIKSRLAGRPMLPKDLWSVKVIVGGGADSSIFADRVEELWGRRPLEIYGATEGGIYATQTWDHAGMTFIPNLNFFEFIPEREYFKSQLDSDYQPKTILMDEVEEGKSYEIVLTSFHGGIFSRYRIGDIVKITSMRDESLGIDTPQMVFQGRADDFVDVTSLGRLTERMIEQAVRSTTIPQVDWVARKEIIDNQSVLHLYMELRDGYIASEESLAAEIHEQFRKLDKRHRCNLYNLIGDMQTVLGLKPVQVSLLPQGAFAGYAAHRRAGGNGMNGKHRSHINPSDEVISLLRAPKVVVEAVSIAEEERAVTR